VELKHFAVGRTHLTSDKILQIQRDRVSFTRQAAHIFAQDALGICIAFVHADAYIPRLIPSCILKMSFAHVPVQRPGRKPHGREARGFHSRIDCSGDEYE
jgi:hypothetical protein